MTRAEKIQIGSNIATIIGVIASVAFAVSSQCISREALDISKDLKVQAERVSVSFEGKFDDQKRIELLPISKTRREAVLKLYAKVKFKNRNPYRAIIIEGIYPTFVDGSKPSELETTILENDNKELGSFSLSSLAAIERKVLISWPIHKNMSDFVKELMKNRKSLQISDVKLEFGKHPQITKSQRHRHVILHLRTTPKPPEGKEIKAKLTLY